MYIFIILTIIIFVLGLISRITRGTPIVNTPRKFEKIGLWKIKNKTIHIHHGFLGIAIIILAYLIYNNILMEIGLSLFVSDVIFHIIAYLLWKDPPLD